MSVNFFSRLTNLWQGFVSLWLEDVEKKHPEIAYSNSINAMVVKYTKLKNASAAIIRRRQEIESRLENRKHELTVIENQLQQAIATDQDDLGAILIQKQEALQNEITTLSRDFNTAKTDADNAKSALINVKSEIDNLKAEKDRMLAQFHSASARVQIQEQLDGLSVDAEIRALDTVRTHIKDTVAKADLNQELKDNDLDTRLAKLSQTGAGAVAQNKFAAMKAAAKSAQGKTI